MKTIIVQGSSRSDGNTRRIIELFRNEIEADLIDLSVLNIGFYDYEHKNLDDDFLPVMKRLIEYDLIVFATPVYWYAMSGLLKTFFDRITDCLRIEKETGRKLRGKSMAAICCGSEEMPTEGFFFPFRSTAEYLGMKYLGDVHTWIEDTEPEEKVFKLIEEFSLKVKNGFNG